MIGYALHRGNVKAQLGRADDVTAVGLSMGFSISYLIGPNLVSEMLSDEPGSVSYGKLVTLDVVRCPRLNRQGVTESRAKENGSLVVSHTWRWY